MFRNLINQKYPNIKFKRKLKKNKNLRTTVIYFFSFEKKTQNVQRLGFVFGDFSAFGNSEILM